MTQKDTAIGNGQLEPSDKSMSPIDRRSAWGSDVAADMLRALDISYIALNPGASYRGLHDSLVNHLGNHAPEMLVCLHEEHAVAIAHGYARVTGKPMAVGLHANVGLMHATMAIFNAWCDRIPMLLIGATGPMDAVKRRPWIDWVHTMQDQAALVRSFTKWDDQPSSVEAIPESILRGWQITRTAPCAPVYVCLDAGLQEEPLDRPVRLPDMARYQAPLPPRPNEAALNAALELVRSASRPLLLFGRGERTRSAMDQRLALARHIGARMISDQKAGAMVPTDDPLHVGAPFNKLTLEARAAIREADLIVSLGSIDLGGVLNVAFGGEESAVPIIHAGDDMHLHNGSSKEYGVLPTVDVNLLCGADAAVGALVDALGAEVVPSIPNYRRMPKDSAPPPSGDELTMEHIAYMLAVTTDGLPVTLAGLPRGWPHALFPHREPLDYMGKDGGAGVGAGPGLTIGAALGLRNSDRITIGVLGDGECLMSINAFWTAAKYKIPALTVVANNRGYLNDVLHQDSVAIERERSRENRWVGQMLDEPSPDISAMAMAQGVDAIGPVKTIEALEEALRIGIETVRSGRPFLIDVHIAMEDGRLQNQRGK